MSLFTNHHESKQGEENFFYFLLLVSLIFQIISQISWRCRKKSVTLQPCDGYIAQNLIINN